MDFHAFLSEISYIVNKQEQKRKLRVLKKGKVLFFVFSFRSKMNQAVSNSLPPSRLADHVEPFIEK